MAEDKKLPSEEIQKITDADDGYRNCTVCGLWVEIGLLHCAGDNDNSNKVG